MSILLNTQFNLKGVNPKEWRDEHGDSILHVLVRHPVDRSLIDYVIDQGLDPNVRGDEGKTPLIEACYTRAPILLIEHLVQRGAKINMVSDDNHTALHASVYTSLSYRHPDEAMANWLIDHGAIINIQDRWFRSPLYILFETVSMRGPSLDLVQRLSYDNGINRVSRVCFYGSEN